MQASEAQRRLALWACDRRPFSSPPPAPLGLRPRLVDGGEDLLDGLAHEAVPGGEAVWRVQ
eukprot:5801239-Heterocapsa_arctica.AAC.1